MLQADISPDFTFDLLSILDEERILGLHHHPLSTWARSKLYPSSGNHKERTAQMATETSSIAPLQELDANSDFP